MSRRFAAVLVLVAGAAAAAPPAGVDPDSERAAIFRGMKTPTGASCCDLSDCGEVEYRAGADGAYEALVGAPGSRWPKEPQRWIPIPKETLTPGPLPEGAPAILCYSGGKVICFRAGTEA